MRNVKTYEWVILKLLHCTGNILFNDYANFSWVRNVNVIIKYIFILILNP